MTQIDKLRLPMQTQKVFVEISDLFLWIIRMITVDLWVLTQLEGSQIGFFEI